MTPKFMVLRVWGIRTKTLLIMSLSWRIAASRKWFSLKLQRLGSKKTWRRALTAKSSWRNMDLSLRRAGSSSSCIPRTTCNSVKFHKHNWLRDGQLLENNLFYLCLQQLTMTITDTSGGSWCIYWIKKTKDFRMFVRWILLYIMRVINNCLNTTL